MVDYIKLYYWATKLAVFDIYIIIYNKTVALYKCHTDNPSS